MRRTLIPGLALLATVALGACSDKSIEVAKEKGLKLPMIGG